LKGGKEDLMVDVQGAVLPTEDIHESSYFQLSHEEDHNVIHVEVSTQWQLALLDQLKVSCYEFHDPVVSYMESMFPQVQNMVDFCMTLSCSCKFKLLINFLLQISYFSFILICISEDHFVSNMLSWIHWKYDYT
jgi:hypothetical protein